MDLKEFIEELIIKFENQSIFANKTKFLVHGIK
jgi:hypothetical protein